MNKKKINALLPTAYSVLQDQYNTELPNEVRAYISTFGAAITMGSLESAIAFYSSDGGSNAGRGILSKLIFEVLNKANLMNLSENLSDNLFDYVVTENNRKKVKDDILSATIAIKLATNLFVIRKNK